MGASDFKTRVLPVSKKLFRFATHFMKNEDDAHDVVQDVFLKLWQKRNELHEIKNIEAFAMRMTRNRCLDLLRANKVAPIDAETDRKLREESVDVHSQVENEIMDYILENESQDKNKYRWLWQTVTGIAASVIIVIGGMLLYQQNNQNYEDTFENPEVAYAVAQDALEYMSAKYNKGLAELSNFDKLQEASKPLKKGVQPVNEFYENIRKMGSEQGQ